MPRASRKEFAALVVEEGDDRRSDRYGGQVAAESEPVEFAHCVGQQVDADAERLQFAGPLDDRDVEAPLSQAERGGQSADACPCDEYRFPAHDSTVGEPVL